MSNIETIVIVGAGQAGASAILELRGNKYEGKIILIGDETHLPYERPPLSKDVILKPEEPRLKFCQKKTGGTWCRNHSWQWREKSTLKRKRLNFKMVTLLLMTNCCLPRRQHVVCRTSMRWVNTFIRCVT